MSRQSRGQKATIERVMHEFKEGDLRIRGTGPKVKNPKQAIAIALREAGASDRQSPRENRKALARTKRKEGAGGTRKAKPRERLGANASKAGRARTRAELYAEARRRDLPGRSRMSKADLEKALRR